MANRRAEQPTCQPVRLPLFPDHPSWPDLFDRALLIRRIGSKGCRRLDPYPDPGAAVNALGRLMRVVGSIDA